MNPLSEYCISSNFQNFLSQVLIVLSVFFSINFCLFFFFTFALHKMDINFISKWFAAIIIAFLMQHFFLGWFPEINVNLRKHQAWYIIGRFFMRFDSLEKKCFWWIYSSSDQIDFFVSHFVSHQFLFFYFVISCQNTFHNIINDTHCTLSYWYICTYACISHRRKTILFNYFESWSKFILRKKCR